ncbi:6603_t:CDS:2, partial [Racocetra fulgida]
MKVIPAKRSESWVWSFVSKRTQKCEVLIKNDNRTFNHLLDWLIDDMQAFHLVDNLKFHKFVYKLNSNYQLSADQIENTKRNLKQQIELLEFSSYQQTNSLTTTTPIISTSA